ncbi:MAG: hypothetical protein ACR2RF_32345 [Geminicoccaceae bacterium]
MRPLVAEALDRADEYSVGDVLHYAYTGKWQTWHGERSVAFTRIATYPTHTACIVILCAGDLSEIKELEPQICAWARRMGCKYMKIYGRRGWHRALDDYAEQSAVLRKEL